MSSEEAPSRLGLFGGTFNPVHLGHLILAQDAMEEYELDRVLFVPCATPPHKGAGTLAAAEHRARMLELAVEADPGFEVSRLELDRGGISYSVDTVREVRRLYPEAKVYFIIGADSLFEIHGWKNCYELLELCEFIVMGRPRLPAEALHSDSLCLRDPWAERLCRNLTSMHLVDISSTDVRMRVAEGLSIRYLVTDEVAMYIGEHSLYRM